MPFLVLDRDRSTTGHWEQASPASLAGFGRGLAGLPKAVREARRAADPNDPNIAKDAMVSLIEGVCPTRPISSGKLDGNPPLAIHGLVVDLDLLDGISPLQTPSPLDLADRVRTYYATGAARARSYGNTIAVDPPDFLFRSPGGGVRLVWELPSPMRIPQRVSDAHRLDYDPIAFANEMLADLAKALGLMAAKSVASPLLKATNTFSFYKIDPRSFVCTQKWMWADPSEIVPVKLPTAPKLFEAAAFAEEAFMRHTRPTTAKINSVFEGRIPEALKLLEERFPDLKQYAPLQPGQALPMFFNTSDMSPLANVDHTKKRCQISSEGPFVFVYSSTHGEGAYGFDQLLPDASSALQSASLESVLESFVLDDRPKGFGRVYELHPSGSLAHYDCKEYLSTALCLRYGFTRKPVAKDKAAADVDAFYDRLKSTPSRKIHSDVFEPFNAFLHHELAQVPQGFAKNVAGPKIGLTALPEKATPEDFPFTAAFLSQAMGSRALAYFLAYWKSVLVLAEQGKAVPGQFFIVAGPANSAKTSFFQNSIYPMFHRGIGGADAASAAHAAAWMLGDGGGVSRWTGGMTEHFISFIDDSSSHASAAGDFAARERISRNLKSVVGSGSVKLENKGDKPIDITYSGRVVMLLNDDDVKRLVPSIEQSLRDKIMLFRFGPLSPKMPRMSKTDACERFLSEHAAFARWLIDWEVPPFIKEKEFSNKYPSPTYADEGLLEASEHSEALHVTAEVLCEFRDKLLERLQASATGPFSGGKAAAGSEPLPDEGRVLTVRGGKHYWVGGVTRLKEQITLLLPDSTARDFNRSGLIYRLRDLATDKNKYTPWLEHKANGTQSLFLIDLTPSVPTIDTSVGESPAAFDNGEGATNPFGIESL